MLELFGERAAGRPRRLAGGLGRGRRRDLRHRLRGGAARAGDAPRSRPPTAAGRRSSPATSPPASTPRAARSREPRSRPRSPSPSTRAKLGHRVAPGKSHTGELRRGADRHPRRGAGRPPAAEIDPAVLGLAPRRGHALDQVQLRPGRRSPAARAASTGAVRMCSLAAIRAGAGYATVAVPADLEQIVEAAQPEVMSVGCPGGDGCLAPASAKAVLRAFERAAGGCVRPRPRPRSRCGRAGARGRSPRSRRRSCVDADGLNAFAGRLDAIAAREAPTILTPHAGELGRLLGRDSEEISAHRVASAREAARCRRRGRRPQGRRHDRHRRRSARRQRPLGAGAGDGRHRRRPLRRSRGAARARPGALRAACAAVLAHARAGRDAAARVGAAESVIATDVIDSIAVGMLPGSAVE